MARTARKKSSIGAYHVILRGQKKLFPQNDDINEFFNTLRRYFDSDVSELFAYSIENKKIHLVFRSKKEINDVIKPLCTSFARFYNRTYNKSGKLFYDRFMSEPLESINEISDAVVFVHSKETADTSYYEYSEKENLCSVSSISSEKTKILNNSCKRFFLDDYASMSDRELKNYILNVLDKKDKKLTPDEKQEIVTICVSGNNLAKSRICSILGLNVNKVKDVSKRQKTNKRKNDNRELSVWLL